MIDEIGTATGGSVIEGGGASQSVNRQEAQSEDAGADRADADAALREELAQANERIAALEAQLSDASQGHELERLLIEAGAIDLETAAVLAERRMAETGVTAEEAVRALVNAKGYLFRSVSRPRYASAVSGAPGRSAGALEDLAIEARETGDRRAVLRYLRRRRG